MYFARAVIQTLDLPTQSLCHLPFTFRTYIPPIGVALPKAGRFNFTLFLRPGPRSIQFNSIQTEFRPDFFRWERIEVSDEKEKFLSVAKIIKFPLEKNFLQRGSSLKIFERANERSNESDTRWSHNAPTDLTDLVRKRKLCWLLVTVIVEMMLLFSVHIVL